MKILKFWYVPCLLFCLYCLHTLVADSYEVLYEKSNETDPVQFLTCVELSRVFPKRTEIDLKELRGQLFDHFNSSNSGIRRRPREFEEFILNRTKSGGYLVLNRRICLIANDREELRSIYLFLPRRTVFFAIKGDTFDFVRMQSSDDQIDQLIVRKKEPPYSDCNKSNSRFRCLNECFRRSFRLARYFYDSNEIGSIQLNYSESNQTIQESERNCFRECKRENCKLAQLILVSGSKTETFEAQPRLSEFDFWLQVIGLIFSFVGLFFDQFASIATKFTKSRVRRRKVKIGLFYLNLAILLLSLTYCGYLFVRLVLDHQAEVNDLPEREKTRNLIQPKTVHVAICVYIKKYVGNPYEKMMSEIERATDGALDDTLEGIYVNYGGKLFTTDYHVHRKILFIDRRRCFPLSIHPNYPTIPSNPILTIRFKKKYYPNLYILSEEENLNSNSFEYSGYDAFQKRIVKRLKSNGKCVNYEEKYASCTGRQNCVERCINRKFIERYNKTTFGIWDQMINKDWFSSSEWNTSKPMEIPYDNRSIYRNVSRKCEMEIPDEKQCDETKFEKTVGINPPDEQTLEIDLQFDVVRSVEKMPSSLQMALNLLSNQSIFFGFTFLKLFWVVYEFIKPKWRVRNDKVVWFLICLLCSIGCSWNTVRILDAIVIGELVPTEHYEIAERVQMPEIVFCLRIDQKLIDRNHQLTGNYLEQLTREMNAGRAFKQITYLNESNEWTPFDLSQVERFFLLNMKCFRIDIDRVYNRNQFHFSDDSQVLKVNFNKIKDGENEFVYFMTQSKETAEFSKIVYLNYLENIDYDYGDTLKPRYSITHEAFLYEYEDRFSFFRRYFPSLPEGDVGDLYGQLLELQRNEPNQRTLNLPVEKEHFDLEVNEDLFEQLYLAQKRKNRNKRTNLNYRRLFMVNHLKTEFDSKSDFKFHLIFLQKVVHSTNEVNYATLTFSLFNLLYLWLELDGRQLRTFLVRFHAYLLVYLYLHLPVYLFRKLIKGLLFCSKWLKIHLTNLFVFLYRTCFLFLNF